MPVGHPLGTGERNRTQSSTMMHAAAVGEKTCLGMKQSPAVKKSNP